MRFIKELYGFSGCKLHLLDHKSGRIVRKYARNKDYNSRLKMQAEKQLLIGSLSAEIKAPRILGYGHNNGIFYFDMEYIMGENALSYLFHSDFAQTKKLLDKIFGILKIFKSKKCSNKKTLHDGTAEKADAIIRNHLFDKKLKNKIYDIIAGLKKISCPGSICHGDFTLENIFLDFKGSIYLMDMLDSYYDSYWFDIMKLYQNIEADGYKINHGSEELSASKKLYLLDEFQAFCGQEAGGYRAAHQALMLMTFMRMLPYARDTVHIGEIMNRVRYYCKG